MDKKDTTKIFWSNVNTARVARGMTWDELGRECSHDGHTLMSLTPSFEFALEIAGALSTSIEALSEEDHVHVERSGTMTDVLACAARGLSDEDVILLVRIAEVMKETRGIRYTIEDEGVNDKDQIVADLRRRYL